MKITHLIHTGIALIIVCSLVGCRKYLDTPADNTRTPQTVVDYTEMLNGEGWNRNLPPDGDLFLYFLDMMTADVDETIGPAQSPDEKGPYSAFYTWQNIYDSQYDERQSPSDILNNTWLGLYRIIKACNIIIGKGEKIEGEIPARKFLLGEAHFSRALAYYYLINIWGRPYDPKNEADPMGVPISTESTLVNTSQPRSSVIAVYNQILEDLNTALTDVQASGKKSSIFHYSPAAICLLLSRIHLYMQHWEQAAAFADKCLEINPALKNNVTQQPDISDFYTGILGAANPEIIYTFYNDPNPTAINNFGSGNGYGFSVSSSLLLQYDSTDQRLGGYYYSNNVVVIPKTSGIYGGAYCFSFRTSEAYLNRAEANAHLGENEKARADLDLLRSHRVKTAGRPQQVHRGTLLEAILLERRKELAFQLHNWFDLRRTTAPSITHYFTPVINQQVRPRQQFILKKNDPGYTLEIPARALQANPALKPLGLERRLPL